jgi:hypothetical protein
MWWTRSEKQMALFGGGGFVLVEVPDQSVRTHRFPLTNSELARKKWRNIDPMTVESTESSLYVFAVLPPTQCHGRNLST